MTDVASSRPHLVRLYVACCLFRPSTSKGKRGMWRGIRDGTDNRERARYMSARLTANLCVFSMSVHTLRGPLTSVDCSTPTEFGLTW